MEMSVSFVALYCSNRLRRHGFVSRSSVSKNRDPLPEITGESLRDKVVSSLKSAFFSGHLKPGEALVERQLAQQMKVGSPAVREALITLQQQGFVRRVANTATYVNSFSVDEVRQLYQIRVEMELLSLKWAKPRVTNEDISVLEIHVEAMAAAASEKDSRKFFENDLEFHRHCWKLSGNKYLEQSLENLVPALFAFVLNRNSESVQEVVAKQHLQIISALKSAYEPEFTAIIRDILNSFAIRAVSSVAEGRSSSDGMRKR
jgi:DNA-binding GntR family transcriptional regulator